MSISINLDEEQAARLEQRARELGVDASELAKAAVNDLLVREQKTLIEPRSESWRRTGNSIGG